MEPEDLTQLSEDLGQLAEDAARYRYLRSGEGEVWAADGFGDLSGDDLDRVVDEERLRLVASERR